MALLSCFWAPVVLEYLKMTFVLSDKSKIRLYLPFEFVKIITSMTTIEMTMMAFGRIYNIFQHKIN